MIRATANLKMSGREVEEVAQAGIAEPTSSVAMRTPLARSRPSESARRS